MGQIFFTADTHFSHLNIIKHCNRPFKSLEEMDEAILQNINAIVGENDILYHLGDFARGHHKQYRQRIKCKDIKLVPGNHDDTSQCRGLFDILPPIHDIVIKNNPSATHGQKITLCHYSMRTWNCAFHGAWHLFGHSHNMLPDHYLSFDVGVDCWNFKPISFEVIQVKMKHLKLKLENKALITQKEALREFTEGYEQQ